MTGMIVPIPLSLTYAANASTGFAFGELPSNEEVPPVRLQSACSRRQTFEEADDFCLYVSRTLVRDKCDSRR